MRHVLVVEDDPVNALLFRVILEKRGGFRVTVTESPDEVLAKVRAREVDLVILDVSLSHSRYQGQAVNGIELCRILKADPATAGTPVVLATAHAMRGDSKSLIEESGAEDYVAKPIVDHAAFMQQVQGHLREAA